MVILNVGIVILWFLGRHRIIDRMPAEEAHTADEVGIPSASFFFSHLLRERSSGHRHQIRLVETIRNHLPRSPEAISERSYGRRHV